jgi:hypothetical protein
LEDVRNTPVDKDEMLLNETIEPMMMSTSEQDTMTNKRTALTGTSSLLRNLFSLKRRLDEEWNLHKQTISRTERPCCRKWRKAGKRLWRLQKIDRKMIGTGTAEVPVLIP